MRFVAEDLSRAEALSATACEVASLRRASAAFPHLSHRTASGEMSGTSAPKRKITDPPASGKSDAAAGRKEADHAESTPDPDPSEGTQHRPFVVQRLIHVSRRRKEGKNGRRGATGRGYVHIDDDCACLPHAALLSPSLTLLTVGQANEQEKAKRAARPPSTIRFHRRHLTHSFAARRADLAKAINVAPKQTPSVSAITKSAAASAEEGELTLTSLHHSFSTKMAEITASTRRTEMAVNEIKEQLKTKSLTWVRVHTEQRLVSHASTPRNPSTPPR